LAEIDKKGLDYELIHKPIDREQIIKITKGILETPEAY